MAALFGFCCAVFFSDSSFLGFNGAYGSALLLSIDVAAMQFA